MLRPLVVSLLVLAAPASATIPDECGWAPPRAERCCKEHALRYMQGGTERDRESADRRLLFCLQAEGVDELLADAVHKAASQFAGPGCRGWGCWRYPPPPQCFGYWCRRR